MRKSGVGGVLAKQLKMEGQSACGGAVVPPEEPNDISSPINPTHNPIMNEVVLQHLFEQSRPGDLNRYRLVSKHWYNVALPAWLKNGSTITIKSDRDNDAFLTFLKEVHLAPSTAHEDIVGIKQYRKFHLEHEDDIYSRPHFEVFWNECGQHLTHLTLKHFKIPDVATFKEILFCKFTPNLEYLVVDVKSVESPVPVDPQLLTYGLPAATKNLSLKTLMIDIEDMDEDAVERGLRPFPVDWKSLLNNYPNLKHFGVGRGMSREVLEVREILMAIKEIRSEDKGKLDLKSLKFFFTQCCCCMPSGLNSSSISPLLLSQCGLDSLEAFSFCFSCEDASGELAVGVEDVLSIHSTTLKKLEIYREVPFGRSPFPQMPQLESLELAGYIIKDLTFLKKLPNLRSLRLWGELDNIPTPFPETFISATADKPDMVFPTISEFCCNYPCRWSADPDDIPGLARLMPNITYLGIHVDAEEFPLVCQYFPQLEHLWIYWFLNSTIGDEGLLGAKTIINHGDQAIYEQANVTKLQNLKSLTLKVGDDFTANSVIYGLLKLPRLEKLLIEVDVKEGQAEMKKFILEKLPFANVLTDRDDSSHWFACGQ